MKKTFRITLFIFFLIAFLIGYKLYINDFKEYWVLRNQIIWEYDKNLVWSDFIYDEDHPNLIDNINANVGISERCKITDKLIYRTKTAFNPSKSYVSDTTNLLSLRIANYRFDLCELYRRKLEKYIDSIRQLDIDKIEINDFKNKNAVYMGLFTDEWDKFLEIPKDKLPDELSKLEINISKQLKTTHNRVDGSPHK